MQILIDIPKHHYENIKSIDSVSLGRIPYKGIIMYSINAIKNGVVQEHRKGHWIDCKCDKCGYVVQPWNTTNFCPNCGDMKEV